MVGGGWEVWWVGMGGVVGERWVVCWVGMGGVVGGRWVVWWVGMGGVVCKDHCNEQWCPHLIWKWVRSPWVTGWPHIDLSSSLICAPRDCARRLTQKKGQVVKVKKGCVE